MEIHCKGISTTVSADDKERLFLAWRLSFLVFFLCPVGITCGFIHGPSELQGALQGVWAMQCHEGGGSGTHCLPAQCVPIPGGNRLFPDKGWTGKTTPYP